ncbi:MAG: DUF3375 family protein [Sphaerochaeta sp.]
METTRKIGYNGRILAQSRRNPLLDDIHSVEHLIRSDGGLTLLSRRNAPKIIAFLYGVFKVQQRKTLEQSHLEQLLAGFLLMHDGLEDESVEEQEELEENDYQIKAKNLILSWCNANNGFLFRYYDENNIETLELSAGLERLFRFLEEVQDAKHLFVGTESRFAQIIEGFKELDVNTIDDPTSRIEELEKRKATIQNEIDEIKRTGKATTYTNQSIAERLYNLEHTGRDLLSDFRQLKDNNHALFTELCRKQIEATQSRGELLGFTMQQSEELEQSSQGQSFTAFWNYLCNNEEENSIKTKADNLKQRLSNLPFNHEFFSKLEDELYEAGHEILEENHLLSDRLKRAITRQSSKEYQLIAKTLHAIQTLAQKNTCLRRENMMELVGSAEISSNMLRYAVFPDVLSDVKVTSYAAGTDLEVDLNELFNETFVDEAQLLENLMFDRNHVQNLTLATVLERHPVKEGLAEVVSYLSILFKQEWATFDATKYERITYNQSDNGETVVLTIPKVDIHGYDN